MYMYIYIMYIYISLTYHDIPMKFLWFQHVPLRLAIAGRPPWSEPNDAMVGHGEAWAVTVRTQTSLRLGDFAHQT